MRVLLRPVARAGQEPAWCSAPGPDSRFLAALASVGPLLDRALPFPPGWILIDRCGKHFGTILNYLRDGAVPLPESRREIEELLAEAKYYLVQGLVDECQAALQVGRTAGACCLMTYKPISPCNSRAAQMVPGGSCPAAGAPAWFRTGTRSGCSVLCEGRSHAELVALQQWIRIYPVNAGVPRGLCAFSVRLLLVSAEQRCV